MSNPMEPAVRPHINASLRREVFVEAGHRCAIPTCRGTSALEVAHIQPWSETRDHEFSNLIVLCAVCHTRYDAKEIDRKAMRQYKANLGLLNSRYGDFERRVLHLFAVSPTVSATMIPTGHEIHLMYLLEDGHLTKTHRLQWTNDDLTAGRLPMEEYALSETGRALVERLTLGQPADGDARGEFSWTGDAVDEPPS